MRYFEKVSGCCLLGLKILPEAMLNSIGLISLAEEILKQPYVESMV